jgi:uncharacterized membrane protein YgcG
MNIRCWAALLIVSLCIVHASVIVAEERIREFDAAITIAEDGKINVVETIVVKAERNKINRGIYRDFPTLYTSRYLVKIRLPFTVKSVTRDGKAENFRTENQANGVRVYIGRQNVLLQPKTYRYEITYETNYQIGYFDTHDEFYWNVTGNGWDFPIDKARASVRVPDEIPRGKMTAEGYTGPAGSEDRNLTAEIDPATGTAVYQTTAALPPHHGLTIVLTMPKGFLREPTAAERSKLYLAADRAMWTIVIGTLAVFAYYLFAWLRVGRDPAKGTIIPRFQPPQGMSPAVVRYLWRMAYDKKCFTAAVINLAVKQVLTIEDDDGEFTLTKVTTEQGTSQPPVRPLSADEELVAERLITGISLKLKQSNHTRISAAITRLGKKLEDAYHGKLFYLNRVWLIPGWILSAVAVAVAAITSGWESLPVIAFLCVWLSLWTVGVGFLSVMVFTAWHSAFALRSSSSKRIGSLGGAMFLTLFATPFVVAEFVVLGIVIYHTSILMLPLIVVVIACNWLFWHLIKRPTDQGQKVRDEIEGFRMYLGTAEQEFLRQIHPPQKTVAVYEEYLPYALALDVENEWAENFKDVLAAAAAAPGDDRTRVHGYHPTWYRGSGWNNFATGAFSSGLGAALGTAIASSATAPGSSSGSSSFGGGGGGSSGGGGGGGGGGGW